MLLVLLYGHWQHPVWPLVLRANKDFQWSSRGKTLLLCATFPSRLPSHWIRARNQWPVTGGVGAQDAGVTEVSTVALGEREHWQHHIFRREHPHPKNNPVSPFPSHMASNSNMDIQGATQHLRDILKLDRAGNGTGKLNRELKAATVR